MKTFQIGGVHPEDNKFARNAPIEDFPLPSQAIVFLSQHLGVPATPIVSVGQEVKTGELIAKAEAFISANIHAPISGKISKIEPIKDCFGQMKPAIVIDRDGDVWESNINQDSKILKEIPLSPKEIIDKIKEMGIVGLGGACFPTHVKYMIPDGKKAEFLIINAVECEPYLTSDHRVMLETGAEALVGISIMKKALGVKKVIVGIENNKPDAIEKMKELASSFEGIEICPLRVKYPQGAEKQLIKALTGRVVPSGKLPIDIGCVVNNIGTALAIYEAVQKNKPLIENILTVTGKGVEPQRNFRVRIGVSFDDIIQYVGGTPANVGKIISGGPMMGKAIVNIQAPTVKGTSSILFINEDETKRGLEKGCIRCGKCIDACPMGLEPYLYSSLFKASRFEDAVEAKLMDCIECGCCLFSCPAHKPLLDEIRLSKSKYRQNITQKNNK